MAERTHSGSAWLEGLGLGSKHTQVNLLEEACASDSAVECHMIQSLVHLRLYSLVEFLVSSAGKIYPKIYFDVRFKTTCTFSIKL